jgi:hypothetical protein
MANTAKPQEPSNQGLAVTAPEKEVSVVLSEGTRQELERNGHAVSPFTGALLIGTPDSYKVLDPAKQESQDEYNRVARENHKRANAKKESNLI